MISMHAFAAIEHILSENGIPIPEGRGREKLDKIARLIETANMPDAAKKRIRNLLRTG
ncbi:MAG: hypothetical protein Q8R35_00995 [bacterium]|nr:hypothetical protein [bacterium]